MYVCMYVRAYGYGTVRRYTDDICEQFSMATVRPSHAHLVRACAADSHPTARSDWRSLSCSLAADVTTLISQYKKEMKLQSCTYS